MRAGFAPPASIPFLIGDMKMAEKTAIATKRYSDENDNLTASWTPEARYLVFTFSNGQSRTLDPSTFPADMKDALLYHGASQKFGDSYASAAKAAEKEGVEPAAWAIDKFDTMLENIMESRWVDRATGLTSTNLLVQALIRAARENYGAELPEEQAKQVVGNMSEEVRKQVIGKDSSMPEVRAAYMAIQAERMAERARKAGDNAEGSELGDLLDSLGG